MEILAIFIIGLALGVLAGKIILAIMKSIADNISSKK